MTEEDILKAKDPAKTSGKSASKSNKTPKKLKGKSKIRKKPKASASKNANNAKGLNIAMSKASALKDGNNAKGVLQAQQEKPDLGESCQRRGEENKNNVSEESSKDQKGKEKHDDARNNEKEKRELGGLIFFCNAKTKPDFFRYQVMGVSMSKKDLILAVKPGLKLFLFDYDLKMLYGIFKASSSGGIKLEPKAFDGAFPAQVRFEVYKDCHPLPESVFKKAIEENYNSRHKFDTELTVQQVKRLAKLYRPSDLRSNATVGRSPAIQERGREVALHAGRGQYLLDNFGDGRRYPVQIHESSQHAVYQEVPPLQREKGSSLYLTEREYRVYGLQGERRNPAALQHGVPGLESHGRDTARGHLLRHPDSMHRVTVPSESESINSMYLNGRDYQTYSLGGGAELSAYLAPLRREDVSSGNYAAVGGRDSYMVESDPLLRINPMDRLYSTYASSLSNRDRLREHEVARTDPVASLPVISRYSFPGPSLYH